MKLRTTLGIAAMSLLVAACRHRQDDPVVWGAATPFALTAPPYFGPRADSLETPMTVEGITLGKALFSDSSLSADGRISCQSCHVPSKAFSDPRTVSLGIHGRVGARNSMALVNLAWQTHFFWDGRARKLEDQILEPMTRPEEMGLAPAEIDAKLQHEPYITLFAKAFKNEKPTFLLARRALGMFIRTLVSGKSRYELSLSHELELSDAEQRGERLFFQHAQPNARGGNCGDCHKAITTMGNTEGFFGFANNGLDTRLQPGAGLETVTGDTNDRAKFKIPSLRNIALTTPYMHDGRFQTLEQVLDHYNDPDLFSRPKVDILIQSGRNNRGEYNLGLTDQEKADIIAFLHTLTDTTYLHP